MFSGVGPRQVFDLRLLKNAHLRCCPAASHLGGVARSRSLRVATPPLRNRRRIAEEMGDLLFVLVNVGRFLGIDPEEALKGTLKKFCARFQYIETSLHRAGKTVQESNMIELDRLWNEAKKSKKNLKRG